MSRIVLLEPFSSAVALIDRATDLGHEVIVVTADDGLRRVPEASRARAAHVEVVDTNDTEATAAAVKRLDHERPVHAVLPGFEYVVPLAARIAADLGLVGNDPEAAWRLRHKHAMRAALAAAGIDQPDFAVIADDADLAPVLARIGQPAVVKPVDLAGSLAVRKVTNIGEARDALDAVLHPHDVGIGVTSLPLALVEEYVAGPEFSVEGFVQHGTVHVLGITAKLLGAEPSFVEVGHVVPADLPATDAGEIAAYVRRVAAAVGLTVGPFHAEVRLSTRGPLLMEIAARLGGDRIPDLLRLATGTDLVEAMLACFLDEPVDLDASRARGTGHAGIRFFLRPEIARYHGHTVATDLHGDPGVADLQVYARPGVQLHPPDSSFGRLGHAVVTGPTHAEVRSLLDRVDAAVTFR